MISIFCPRSQFPFFTARTDEIDNDDTCEVERKKNTMFVEAQLQQEYQ